MSNDKLVHVPVSPESWAMIQSIAPIAQASRMFGVTQEQAAIVMLKGHELGIGVAAAFEFIHVIDGKPSISPKGALALIHNSGLVDVQLTRLIDNNGKFEGFKCWMRRRSSGFEYAVEFTLEDARQAQLIKPNSGWEKYPEQMCQWRSVGFCADVVCPDIIGGMLRPDDLGAVVDADGDPIITVIQPPRATPPIPPAPQAQPTAPTTKMELTVADILNAGFSAEQIVVANEGRIPATSEDCERVLAALQAGA